MFRKFVMFFGLFFVLTSAARGDVSRASVSGTVTDSSGAVLPDVSVTVRNADTGVSRRLPTTPGDVPAC